MAYRAVLDANVLFPFSLRDTLLRLAELEFYDCLWSDRILDEMARNLVAEGKMDDARAGRLCGVMNEAFEDAAVPAEAISALEPAMTNAAEDRHVLAAAIASGADAIITQNLKHFPPGSYAPYRIDVTHPDEFLCVLFDMDPDTVCQSLRDQAADLTRPARTIEELLDALERGGMSEFVTLARAHLWRG